MVEKGMECILKIKNTGEVFIQVAAMKGVAQPETAAIKEDTYI
jgi:hypothetical protein